MTFVIGRHELGWDDVMANADGLKETLLKGKGSSS